MPILETKIPMQFNRGSAPNKTTKMKIVGYPKATSPLRKWSVGGAVEAERLARLTPGEWQLWIDRLNWCLHVQKLVKAIVREEGRASAQQRAERGGARPTQRP